MARQEQPREDLLRDARALVPRMQVKLTLEEFPDPVFWGFRDEAVSVYFGEDPAYHFNPSGELRRSYCGGRLYKSIEGKLVTMVRERTDDETLLISRTLPSIEQNQFLVEMHTRLRRLASALDAGLYVVDGQVPALSDALDRFSEWLSQRQIGAVALTPHVTG